MQDFDYQDLDEWNKRDACTSIDRDECYGITSETDGGIIAYAIGLEHAQAIVRALNAAGVGPREAALIAERTQPGDECTHAVLSDCPHYS